MICDRCRGAGVVSSPYIAGVVCVSYPCPLCGGCGIAHCCDGDQPSARDMEEEND